ncbi:MAG: hypothetical protein HRT36_02505 [Alphaproteobacteria bacterium]|nr:hypothetical protein [Alphaproteobacteria bacterium]
MGVTADTTGIHLRYVPYEGANYVQVVMTSVSRGNIEVPFSDQKAVHGQFRTGKLILTTEDDLPLKVAAGCVERRHQTACREESRRA